MKKLTAVEWLWEQIDNAIPFQNIQTSQIFNGLLEQAKELEKEQIVDAYDRGFKYATKKTYTKEELKSAFKVGFSFGYGSNVQDIDRKNETCESWFKQFKKK